jgi:hypothetical protein
MGHGTREVGDLVVEAVPLELDGVIAELVVVDTLVVVQVISILPVVVEVHSMLAQVSLIHLEQIQEMEV